MERAQKILDEINDMGYSRKIGLNEAQAAKIIGVQPGTLANWRKQGIGPEFKKMESGSKGKVIYTKMTIAEWLANTIKTA
jgi:transposase-like protein